ncbi:MAG: hypothetical protein HQ536_02085 [Parcubacteria group bacterium]|nr:hypothetical protein [Parcubacteria group bacterium]
MSNINTKTAELIISGEHYTGTVLRLISPTILNTDPSGKSRIFGIIQSPNTKIFKIIDETINFGSNNEAELQDSYNSADFSSTQLATESQLETLLQSINSKINTLLSEKELVSTIANTNIILGLQNENAVSLAGRGKIKAMVIRPKKNLDELERGNSYEIINLLKHSDEVDMTSGEEVELFSHFLSGAISSGDTLTLSTENLWERIKEEDLIRGIAVLPPNSAVEFIKNNLSKWTGGGATALLLKYNDIERIQPTQRHRLGQAFKSSVDELVGTEKKTEKILSTPSVFKKSVASFFNIFNPNGKGKTPKNYHQANGPAQQGPKKGAGIEKKLRKFFDYSIYALGVIINFILKLFRSIFLIIKNKNGRDKVLEATKNDFKESREGLFKWFNALPKRSRILLVVAIFLTFIFTQSIFLYNIKQNYEKKKVMYVASVQQIKDTAEEAEASMIYGDNQKAESLLQEADNILVELSKKTKKEKDQSVYLRELLNEKWIRLHHVVDISEPRLLADLGNTGGELLVELGGSIYILSPESTSILKLDPDNGQITPHLLFETTDQAPSFWTEKDKQSVIVFKKNNLPSQDEISLSSCEEIILNTTKTKSLDCSLVSERIKDISIFNNNLYALSPDQNQIWKHVVTASGFTQKKNG